MAKKKIDPELSATANTLPYRLHFTYVIVFLCTLNVLISTNDFSSSPMNLTRPSENPTASIRPLFFLENGNHSMQVD